MSTQNFLRIPEVAKRLRASTKTVRRRIDFGMIPSFKEGGRIFVLAADLDEYMANLTRTKSPQ